MATKKARGRKPDASSKSGKIRELLKTGMSPMDIAKKVGCTPGLVYNIKSKAAGGGKRRGPGRPPKASKGKATASGDLGSLLDSVRGIQQQRAQLANAIEKIRDIIAGVLG